MKKQDKTTKSNVKTNKSVKANKAKKVKDEFTARFNLHKDELKWLYMELYNNEEMFESLAKNLKNIYRVRSEELKKLDSKVEKDKGSFSFDKTVAMSMKPELFCDGFKDFKSKLGYVEKLGVNLLHLTAIFAPEFGFEDNGFAVVDYRRVNPCYGSNEDFYEFLSECRKKDILISTDFLLNHTSDRHIWAMNAKYGMKEYQDYYFFYDNWDIPAIYERNLPEKLPNTAPGNFTYIECINKHVMTTFNRYEWDLNYYNPSVFNEVVYNILYVANMGVNIINLDALEYIWKDMNTNCCDLPQVHNIARMLRIITEIVCPSVLLSTGIQGKDVNVNAFFGSKDYPECHLVGDHNNQTDIWNALATQNADMLCKRLDMVSNNCYINSLRSFFNIDMGISKSLIEESGFDPYHHKKFLCDFLCGSFPDSFSRAEAYSFNPYTGESKICAMTASLCGLEKAVFENDEKQKEIAIDRILFLHALIFVLPGIPVLYSGDEIGLLNDYSYKEDNLKCVDANNLHRVKFDWEKAGLALEKGSTENKIFSGIKKIEAIRKKYKVFSPKADFGCIDTGNSCILTVKRTIDSDTFYGIFNFSGSEQTIELPKEYEQSKILNLKTTRSVAKKGKIKLAPYAFELHLLK